MSRLLKRTARRVVERVFAPTLELAFQRSVRDIGEWRQRNALAETGQFVEAHMPFVPALADGAAVLAHAISRVTTTNGGLVCEFGVATGRTINQIAKLLPDTTVYGFDSFEGLPETWQSYYPKGSFKMATLPPVSANVELIKGWFNETLPGFLQTHAGAARFVHVDCDLYSSTSDVFALLESRIGPGCVLVFDEFFNYPGWRAGEYKAFTEFIARTGHRFEYLSYAKANEQVAVQIMAVD